MITSEQLNLIKSFDWDEIFKIAKSVDDLNDRQWRFLKGLVLELSVEKYSNENFKYVGEIHKDFIWKKQNLDIELKTMTSFSMYKKDGNLRKSYSILLNNSMGTNNKNILNKNEVSDIVLVIYNDGAFLVEKDKILENAIRKGDGFTVKLCNHDILEITGKKSTKTTKKSISNLRENITNLILDVI